MIRVFSSDNGRLKELDDLASQLQEVIWIDLLEPTPEEVSLVEKQLGVYIPTKEEMEEIEISSRLYTEEEAAFMTATFLSNTDTEEPMMAPITFILAANRLITVRYHTPKTMEAFPYRAAKTSLGCVDGNTTLLALLEAFIDRIADTLEKVGRDIELISREIFKSKRGSGIQSHNFQGVLRDIGSKGDLTSKIRESLGTLDRLIIFFGHLIDQTANKELRARHKTLSKDVYSLADHSNFFSQKTTFLLEAMLGMVNIEQNAIIKIFSVAAVVFLPPTLIASIYGMNFHWMPELGLRWGYPFALFLMILSAVLPYLYFKQKKWL